MLKLLFKKKSVSLAEILISAAVFSVAAVGTFSALSTMRQASDETDRSLQAVYYGRQIFDELRGKVDQATWNAWDLTCDNAWRPWAGDTPSTAFFSNFSGSANYLCEDIAVGSNPSALRKVTLNIIWQEP